MKHTIEITIEPGGKSTAEVFGVEGDACEMLSKWIDSLGEVIEHRRKKETPKTKVKNPTKVGA
jgi:hypothetical protein